MPDPGAPSGTAGLGACVLPPDPEDRGQASVQDLGNGLYAYHLSDDVRDVQPDDRSPGGARL